MNATIQLQKKAAVLAADGHPVGLLNRVVVDPADKALNAIVVRVGSLFRREEKVVPIELIAETSENQIVLNQNAGDIETFPPLEEEYIVDEREPVRDPPYAGSAGLSGVGHADLGARAMRVAPGHGMIPQVRQNIPDGTIVMDENPKIITLEGIHVGNVERILADPTDEHMTGLVVSNGLFVKEMKLIPIQWVTEMGMEHIHLCVKKASVEELADLTQAG